jgi:hypothetical protein
VLVEVVIAISTEIMWGGINLCDDQYTLFPDTYQPLLIMLIRYAFGLILVNVMGNCRGKQF